MERKHTHLEMVQGVINRLATNSFLLKGWSVVLISGLFALAAKDANPKFVYLAYLPALAFWALDAYFLWQERLYRALFDHIRVRDPNDIDYSMNAHAFEETAKGWLDAVVAPTMLLFHGVLLLTILIVMLIQLRT